MYSKIKKIFFSALLISLSMLSADEVLIQKDIINIKTFEEKVSIIEEKTFLAIQTKNYKHIIELLQSCAIIP